MAPAFAVTWYVTVPFPEPDEVPVNVTQLSALVAVHWHPAAAVMEMAPVPPATTKASPPGYKLKVQAWVIVKLNVALAVAPTLSCTCTVKL
jgi:hypothetical protein